MGSQHEFNVETQLRDIVFQLKRIADALEGGFAPGPEGPDESGPEGPKDDGFDWDKLPKIPPYPYNPQPYRPYYPWWQYPIVTYTSTDANTPPTTSINYVVEADFSKLAEAANKVREALDEEHPEAEAHHPEPTPATPVWADPPVQEEEEDG